MSSIDSLKAASALPGRPTASSDALGWKSVLARVYEEPAVAEAFTTPPVPELLVVIQLSGAACIESRHGNRWVPALYGPGAVGITAPGNSSTLRWRRSSDPPPRTLQLHLDVDLLRGAAHVLGRSHAAHHLPDELFLDDPVVRATGHALGVALANAAGPLLAESLAHALAAVVAERCMPHRGRRSTGRSPALDPRRVAEIAEYMAAHLSEPLHLDELAAVVHLSKYHFLRAFARTTGTTPHRYLTGVRMRRAAERLRTTDAPVAVVAAQCGFASPSQFTAAFRRHHGCSPTQYRRAMR